MTLRASKSSEANESANRLLYGVTILLIILLLPLRVAWPTAAEQLTHESNAELERQRRTRNGSSRRRELGEVKEGVYGFLSQ
jgi:hypothetical protein